MREVRISDRDIVLAEIPFPYVSWVPEAQEKWLASKGVKRPFTERYEPSTKEHVYEMPEEQ